MKNIFIILFFLLTVNSFAAVRTFYFSNAGNDNNTGLTTSDPFKTIAKLNSLSLTATDHIAFRRGDVFYGAIRPTISNITFEAYGTGAKPIITGFTSVTSWTNLGSNIWESTSAVSTLTYTNMVRINGVNTPMGRYPNATFLTYQTYTANTSITSTSIGATNWTGAGIAIRKNRWTLEHGMITGQSGTTLTYVDGNDNHPNNGFGFFIQNDTRTLDIQNEWYYNPTTKKLRIYSTSSPTNVSIATIDTLVYCNNKNTITFDNISFEGANTSAFQLTNNSHHITISNCDISFTGINGICGVAAPYLDINNNSITYSNYTAILLDNSCSNTSIKYNTTRNIGLLEGMTQAHPQGNISFRGDNSIAQYNVVDSSGYNGIFFRGDNCEVRNNLVNNSCMTLDDGGGIYTGFAGELNKVIDGNIVINVIGNNSGGASLNLYANGVYLDDNCTSVTVSNNTIGNIASSAVKVHDANNITIRDNTIYNAAAANSTSKGSIEMFYDGGGGQIRSIDVKNNIFFAKTAKQLCLFFNYPASDAADVKLFGTSDSNYFARPIDDNLTTQVVTPASGTVAYNLAMWQTFSAQDAHSNKSPRTITQTDQLAFFYNATEVATATSLGSTSYVDVKNVAFSGSITLQPYRSAVLISTGSLITPTITWANPAAITYGTALSSTQLNATASVAGTFAYNYSSGTVLSANSYTLTVTFTPSDGTTYSTATKSVPLVVNKALATLTASGMTVTYTGMPQQPTVTTSPAGLVTVDKLYNGSASTPTNVGSYSFSAGLTNANYYANTITGTFVINKATVTINVSNLNQTYTGSPLAVTATTTPNVSGISVTYNGSATVPTNAGSYTVVVSLSNPNYQATTVTTTLVINKKTPTVSWSNPSAITYGTTLSATQLNATASVAGTFVYSPVSGTILNAGTNILSVNFTPTDATNYNSVNNTTASLTVNKATATISLSNLNQVYNGVGKSATATTSPSGLTAITITYNGSTTLPVNAGTYTVSATLNNANYSATAATGSLVISKATATLSLSGLNQNYNGSQRVVTVTSVPSGLSTVSILYNGSSTAPTNAGSYPIVASLSNSNYQASNATGTLIVNKITPTISWSNPPAITYGTALSGTQLNATSGGVAGTFTYTPSSGTILNAGTRSLSVDFTPSDATNYNSVNGTTVNIVVNKATASLTLSNLSQTYDGDPKPITVTTNPVGIGVVAVTYNGSGTVPSAAGSYSINATLTNANYTASPATGTLVISNNAANIFITNYSNLVYTASPQIPTVTSSYTYSITYNGSGTAPTNVGSYQTIATINDGVHIGADTVTMTIIKATPTILWSNPSDITYGTSLSGTQLNATTAIAGSFVYSPASGTILNAGTQILSVAFTPTDAANYNPVPVTTSTIVVNKASATLNVSNTTQVYDGTQKSVTVTTTPSGLTSIEVTYNGSLTPPSAVGTYQVISTLTNSNYTATPDTSTLTISATSAAISISNLNQTYTGSALPATVSTNPTGLSYTVTYNGSATVPINAGSYTVIATLTGGTFTGADTATLVINKSTPVIVWSTPTSITFGTALSSTQLNATTGVAGSFTYLPASGTILNAGTYILSTSFAPTDASNYNPATAEVTITVNKASATLTLSNLSQFYDGTPKPVTIISSPSGLDGIIVTYNGSTTVPTSAGSYAVIGSLTSSNYTASNVSGTLVISNASYILSWATPQPMQQGTLLSAAQLNATSNISGTFTYNYAIGYTVQNDIVLTATFHPTNTNYNTQTISVLLSVYGSPFVNFIIGTYFKNELP
jgi:hypothetical protein